MENQKLKLGNIELDVNTGTSPYLPHIKQDFIDHGDILSTLAIAIKNNLPTLLIGESGTGKTSAIRFLADKTKNGLRRVNLNGGTTADELIGRLLINEKGTYWVDGVLTEAMRNGDWIVLDEINAALPEVLFVLQSILDDDGYLVLTEKDDKEIVQKHPNFRLFATCNPPEYAGTKEMNKALLSRFAICISTDFPSKTKETEIIEYHLGTAIAKQDLTEKLILMAESTRKAKTLGTADYAINTRDILNTLKLTIQLISPVNALMLAFGNKLEASDQKAVQMMAKLQLPNIRKTKITTTPLTSAEDMIIEEEYILKKDAKNAYHLIINNKEKFEELIEKDSSEIFTDPNITEENGVKGDEFIIKATIYENQDTPSIKELPPEEGGAKLASAILFTAGKHKGKYAILPHHKDIKKTDNIIKDIEKIN